MVSVPAVSPSSPRSTASACRPACCKISLSSKSSRLGARRDGERMRTAESKGYAVKIFFFFILRGWKYF